MLNIDRVARAFASQLPAGLDPLRNARVFARRVGPFFSINVVITTVEVNEGTAGDVHATVHLAPGEPPVQDVVEAPRAAAPDPITDAGATPPPLGDRPGTKPRSRAASTARRRTAGTPRRAGDTEPKRGPSSDGEPGGTAT